AAVPALLEALSDADAEVRRLALVALRQLDAPTKEHAPALAGLLKDAQAPERLYAIEALGRLGTQAAEAAPGLTGALKDPNRAVRLQAALAVLKVAPDAAGPAAAVLVRLQKAVTTAELKDRAAAALRQQARLALIACGEPAVTELVKGYSAFKGG